MAMTSLPMLPMASWRWRWQWRGNGDDVAADGEVAMPIPFLPMARWRWRGNGDDVAADCEMAMAMAMAMRPTALRWRRQCCRRRGGGDADTADGEFAMAWQWR